MAHSRDSSRFINGTHDDSTVHITVVIGIHDTHNPSQGDLRPLRRDGLAREVTRHRVECHVSPRSDHRC